MEVTEVQVNLCDNADERLRAYCAVIFDGCFVVHNVRVIEKSNGLLVAMPSRKVTAKCGGCGFKNPIDANFCSNCGSDNSNARKEHGETKIHFDVAHPINAECRQAIECSVLAAYERSANGG